MLESYKSKEEFKVGTVVYDEETGECFEVISCDRIDVLGDFNYGITVKEVKRIQ